ncbi:DUF6428 family protein [Riemerella anatipestifer]|uniref:DUF6428 family protein n=1 Tax=Riemerella anatipestifer TaxID=34085 RepID=UPI000699C8EF|nr:DUF6428 family protein [Riemerella anatipestifer]
MKLSEFKKVLATLSRIDFQTPNGDFIPPHFHITEVGQITKDFIDCGGIVRKEKWVNFQLWTATDYDHRLTPEKLLDIITLSEKQLQLTDEEIEVEYQGESIQKFGLDFQGNHFVLTTKQTDCLAPDKCGIPTEKPKLKLSELQNKTNCCDPNSGCC